MWAVLASALGQAGTVGQAGGQAAQEPSLCGPLGIRLQPWHASCGGVTLRDRTSLLLPHGATSTPQALAPLGFSLWMLSPVGGCWRCAPS